MLDTESIFIKSHSGLDPESIKILDADPDAIGIQHDSNAVILIPDFIGKNLILNQGLL